MLEELYDRLKNIKEKSPVLLIEKAAILFKENYSKDIFRVENQQELKDVVENFTNNNYGGVLVIEDLSLVYDLSVLLKFLEESNIPIILLALKDCDRLSGTLLSRVKTCIKIPFVSPTSNLLSARESLDLWSIEQNKGEQDRFFAQESPELYYLKLKSTRFKCNTKIVELLSGGNK
jgi:hypothetical protein